VFFAHLVGHNCISEFINEVDHFLGIFRLVEESRRCILVQYGPRPLFDLLQGSKREIKTDDGANTREFTWRVLCASVPPQD